MSENDDIKTKWISRYSLKFEGCRNWLRRGDGEEGADTNHPHVQYRLCPKGEGRNCTSGCQDGNSFVVGMNEFIETYVAARQEVCQQAIDKCRCDEDEKRDNTCLTKCLRGTGHSDCIPKKHDIAPERFSKCTRVKQRDGKNRNRDRNKNEWPENQEEEKSDEGDDNGNDLFVGPHCSGDAIYLRAFVDKDCTKVAREGAYERLNKGARLPYSKEPLVGEDCMDCNRKDEPKERLIKDGFAPTCSGLYDFSDKWMGDFLETTKDPATPCGNRRGCNDSETPEETETEGPGTEETETEDHVPEEPEEESEESERGSSGTEESEETEESEMETEPGPGQQPEPEDPGGPAPVAPCQGRHCNGEHIPCVGPNCTPGSPVPIQPVPCHQGHPDCPQPVPPEPEFPEVPVAPCQGPECNEELPEPCHTGTPDCIKPAPLPPLDPEPAPGEPVLPSNPTPPCDPNSNNCDIPEAPIDPAPVDPVPVDPPPVIPGTPVDPAPVDPAPCDPSNQNCVDPAEPPKPVLPAPPPVDPAPPVVPEGDLFPPEGGGDRALLLGEEESWRAEGSHPGAGGYNASTSAAALVVLLIVAAVALFARRNRGKKEGRRPPRDNHRGADGYYHGKAELEDGLVVVEAGTTTDDY